MLAKQLHKPKTLNQFMQLYIVHCGNTSYILKIKLFNIIIKKK